MLLFFYDSGVLRVVTSSLCAFSAIILASVNYQGLGY